MEIRYTTQVVWGPLRIVAVRKGLRVVRVNRLRLPGRAAACRGRPPACAAIATGREERRCRGGSKPAAKALPCDACDVGAPAAGHPSQLASLVLAARHPHTRPPQAVSRPEGACHGVPCRAPARPTSMQKDSSSGRLSARAWGWRCSTRATHAQSSLTWRLCRPASAQPETSCMQLARNVASTQPGSAPPPAICAHGGSGGGGLWAGAYRRAVGAARATTRATTKRGACSAGLTVHIRSLLSAIPWPITQQPCRAGSRGGTRWHGGAAHHSRQALHALRRHGDLCHCRRVHSCRLWVVLQQGKQQLRAARDKQAVCSPTAPTKGRVAPKSPDEHDAGIAGPLRRHSQTSAPASAAPGSTRVQAARCGCAEEVEP